MPKTEATCHSSASAAHLSQDFDSSTAETATAMNMRSSEKPSLASPAISPPGGSTSPPIRPNTNQRQPSNGLRLAPMPKYHPAVYKSSTGSSATTPTSSRSNSRGLLSPRGHARNLSEAQRQHEYQRQMLATLRQTSGLMGIAPSDTPSKPHILPHDSPGPTTPLNLEESGDYLSARSIGEGSPRELAERMVREEQERRSGMRIDHTSPAISPRC